MTTILFGSTVHARFKPKKHRFKYPLVMLALDLSNEISMHKEEAYEIVDFSFQLSDKLPSTYEELKSEIKAYIIINMLSLVTKFH